MSDAIIDAVTAANFRAYFTRDFSYLPTYVATTTYFVGDQVYYGANFYTCILQATGDLPTNVTYWTVTNLSESSYILDADIDKALAQAKSITNPALFSDDDIKEDAFLYCTAHYLVMDFRMAESGIDSKGEGIIGNKSVGSVSVGYVLPESFAKNPIWNYFAQTEYGKKYLSYIIPRLTGIVSVVDGSTRA